jgi:acetyl esterase/lipase
VTDRSQSGESLRTCPDGVWSTAANRQMWDLYLRNGDLGMEGYASPFLAADLSGLPPAYVEVAEFDCLRSEGEAYARRLEAAGCAVETHLVPGTYHGWDIAFGSPLVQRVIERRVAVMKEALGAG